MEYSTCLSQISLRQSQNSADLCGVLVIALTSASLLHLCYNIVIVQKSGSKAYFVGCHIQSLSMTPKFNLLSLQIKDHFFPPPVPLAPLDLSVKLAAFLASTSREQGTKTSKQNFLFL